MWRHARATAKSQQKQFVHSVTYVTDHPSPADYSQGELSEVMMGDDHEHGYK